MGEHATLAPNVSLRNGERISVGARTQIGERVYLGRDTSGRITIGEQCRFGPEVFVTASDYGLLPISRSPTRSGTSATSSIGDDVWLGARVFVGAGVTIGDGCVVSAGSVVTKSLPPGSVAVGIPAASCDGARTTRPAPRLQGRTTGPRPPRSPRDRRLRARRERRRLGSRRHVSLPEAARTCLESLYEHAGDAAFEAIVVDNASGDGTAEMVAEEFPEARLLALAENVGFARAVNLAAEEARGEYLLLLNPDTEVHPGLLDAFLSLRPKPPRGAICGGRTLRPDGRLGPGSCWGAPTLWSPFCFATALSSVFRENRLFDPESLGGWKRDSVRDVDIVTGCLLFVSSQLWQEQGGFDPRFFVYGEDADLALAPPPRVRPWSRRRRWSPPRVGGLLRHPARQAPPALPWEGHAPA